MGRSGKPTGREKRWETGVMEPLSAKEDRDRMGAAMLSSQHSLIASVDELYYGNPDKYPTVQTAYQSSAFTPPEDKATLHLINKRAGIHLKLCKEDSAEGITNFKFVADGEFILEARVHKNKRGIEIFKHSRTSQKKSIYWVIGLGRDQDGTMAKTREFWDTLCRYFQNLSLEQLRYVNLPRRKSLVGATPELDNPSNDLISEVNQDALVLFIPGDGETQGTEWVFTGFLASQSFRDERKSMLEGGEQKSKTKKGGRNRRRR